MKTVGIIIVFIIVLALLTTILLLPLTPKNLDGRFSGRVGVFYYPWFDSGLGSVHWNSSSDIATTVIDKPLLGWYASDNASVLNQHFSWFQELTVDFAVLSWWGIKSHEDNNSKTVFSTLNSFNNYSLKLCIMIEPFNDKAFLHGTGTYDYSMMYEYIYNNYVIPYFRIYETRNSKPLLLMYNGDNLTDTGYFPRDERFSYLVVGMATYCDVIFHHLTPVGSALPQPYKRSCSIAPRYDDSRLGRSWSNYIVDAHYDERIYQRQWDKLSNWLNSGFDALDYVFLCTWNDYSERAQIEPHFDATSFLNDPYYIFDLTKQNLKRLRS